MNNLSGSSTELKEEALSILRRALDDPAADFRDGQWESIEQLLKNRRVLVVQRTGWGKSMVYFIAAGMLRSRGKGPVLIISPLLSLIRNQISAAERVGLTACSINSTNRDDWDAIESRLKDNMADILFIAPERLANDQFRQNVFAAIAANIGLFVIDEAHCISDWGHDFRPDYQKIVRVLNALPGNIPVLATTATANDRVVADIETQLGNELLVQRGSLVRRSLQLQNINLSGQLDRLAWLAEVIPRLPGSGIVYTLTKRDAERVAGWLQTAGISAHVYHSGLENKEEGVSLKEQLENRLLGNKLKVLVATVALGMGFDKPDLSFVIHYQRPASVVSYYQQVGRAGRAVDEARGILLCGAEDDQIADYFIRSAFPPQQHVEQILGVLDSSRNGLSTKEMQKVLNLRKSQIDKTLKYLTAISPAPVVKVDRSWQLTPGGAHFQIDQKKVAAITAIRREEQQQMKAYMESKACLMSFLQQALDDPHREPCGKCVNCSPQSALNLQPDPRTVDRAAAYLKSSYQPVKARKAWPAKDMFEHTAISGYNIDEQRIAAEGRAMCLWRDGGWGESVAAGKYRDGRFSDELVDGFAAMIRAWQPELQFQWVTCIPSDLHPELVPDFAERVAEKLGLRFGLTLRKARPNQQQKLMENSYQKVKNLDGAFVPVIKKGSYAPCLLIDDVVDSGWTFTVAAALLRQCGFRQVFPAALAMNQL